MQYILFFFFAFETCTKYPTWNEYTKMYGYVYMDTNLNKYM